MKKYQTPKLIPLDMSLAKKHEHPGINNKDTYLCLIDGHYYVGGFSRVWYGWNFDGRYLSLQFDAPGTNASKWQQIWKMQARKVRKVVCYMSCPKCNRNMRTLETCDGDPEGFRRDHFCKHCNQTYGVSKSSIFPIFLDEEK